MKILSLRKTLSCSLCLLTLPGIANALPDMICSIDTVTKVSHAYGGQVGKTEFVSSQYNSTKVEFTDDVLKFIDSNGVSSNPYSHFSTENAPPAAKISYDNSRITLIEGSDKKEDYPAFFKTSIVSINALETLHFNLSCSRF